MAIAAQEKLTREGIAVGDMNIVGHSWGTYVGYEVARMLPGKANSFVALDPAANPWPIAGLSGSAHPFDQIRFRDIAENSWAFEGSVFGSDKKASTAHMTMQMFHPFAANPITQHSLVVDTRTRMVRDALEDPNDPVSQHFHLDKLLTGDHSSWPWKENGYGSNPLLPDGYEGQITTRRTDEVEADGTPIYDLDYVTYVAHGDFNKLTSRDFKQ